MADGVSVVTGSQILWMRPTIHVNDPECLGALLIERQRIRPDDLIRALKAQEAGDSRFLGEILVSLGVTTAADVADALRFLEQFP